MKEIFCAADMTKDFCAAEVCECVPVPTGSSYSNELLLRPGMKSAKYIEKAREKQRRKRRGCERR